jgi:hypothetical protein
MNRWTGQVWLAALLAVVPVCRASQSHFLKDVQVLPGDTLTGDISIYRGNLNVAGFVDGNVVVMLGNCRLEPGARIQGNLAVVQGQLELENPDQVGGRISQRDFLKAAQEESSSPFEMESQPLEGQQDEEGWAGDSLEVTEDESEDSASKTWENEDDADLFLAFNRVAGLQLGLQLPTGRNPILPGQFADLTGYGAWAFGSKRPEWRVKLRRKLIDNPNLYLAVGAHRLTDTQDGWMLSGTENSLAGWLLQLDYRDYFDNRGYSGEVGAFLFDGRLHANAGFFRESYEPMDRNTQWSWSRAHRQYRENLFTSWTDSTGVHGYLGSDNQGLRAGLDLRLWREATEQDDDAWQKGAGLTLTYEKGMDGNGYDWNYERLLGNLRFALPLSREKFEHLSGRLLVGTVSGRAPEQYEFRLGGPDALPGYRSKSIDGLGSDDSQDGVRLDLAGGAKAMALFSLENRFSGEALNFWPFSSFDLLLMADVGQIADRLQDMKSDEYRADVGIGISDEDDDFRLAMFRATDSGEADWRLLFRIQRRF